MRVAAFDFDGTLTRRDTLLPFLRFFRGTAATARAMGRVLPHLTVGRRDEAKASVVSQLLTGVALDDAHAAARAFASTLASQWRVDTSDALRQHQLAGHRVVVVSASPALVVAPAVAHFGLSPDDVLATRLEVVDGRLTGRIAGANCRGAEKVARLHAAFGRVSESWAYGDSSGDREMLAWADYPTKVAGRALRGATRVAASASPTASATLSG